MALEFLAKWLKNKIVLTQKEVEKNGARKLSSLGLAS